MTEDDIKQRVQKLVLDAAPVQPAEWSASLRLQADLGYDSLGREELAALLEDEFEGLSVPDEGLTGNAGDVQDLVVRALVVRP
ncbi:MULTISPECIES: acyl carrier protein [Streptomyces]|uniref:acyl carrier protein n=1 Tax=Streptomyces TaxID=1883 RepID=UPI00368D2291